MLGLLAFRVLEWIHPSLGPRVENVFLRVCGVWQSLKEGWSQQENRRTVEALALQIANIQFKEGDYDRIQTECAQLRQENQQCRQACARAEEARSKAVLQEKNVVQSETAVAEYRDLVVGENRGLKQQLEDAKQQLGALNKQLHQVLEQNKGLQSELSQAQQAAKDFEVQLTQQKAIKKTESGQKNGSGEGLGQILVEQMKTAMNRLEIAQKTVPQDSLAAVPIGSLQRILTDLHRSLGQGV
ncbi:MAG: hypothetical protein WCF19_02775 [Chlamydiales bacterium]